MQIYYFDGTKNTEGYAAKNFGDELNLWLWEKLFPEIHEIHQDKYFIGIGTLLNDRINWFCKDSQKIIFGSGVGYGSLPIIDSTWKIYFVRGRLSAKILELDENLAITDPAILVSHLYSHSQKKKYKQSYMPHYMSAIINGEGWQSLCQDFDLHYIDPTNPLEKVLEQISESEVLFTEAMHGAIVADTLRIPWVAVKTHSRVLEFKWQDWLSTLDIDYHPYLIKRKGTIISKKSFLRTVDYQLISAQMALMLKLSKPNLSKIEKMSELTEKVMAKVELFQNEYFSNLSF